MSYSSINNHVKRDNIIIVLELIANQLFRATLGLPSKAVRGDIKKTVNELEHSRT